MNFFIVNRKHNLILILGLMLIVFAIVGMLGCKKQNTEDLRIQDNISKIERFYYKLFAPVDERIQRRVTKAISLWRNEQVDSVPILFYASVVQQSETGEYYLALVSSDEDENLLGVGIREENIFNGQEVVIEERYPVYIQHTNPAVWISYIPIKERTANQTKDETAWSLYMRGEGEFSIAKEKIPPLWISLPDDPNRMPEVFLYDKDGHVSEFVHIVISE